MSVSLVKDTAPRPLLTHYVNVYRLDREYGGPEEGGWWYDMREAVRSTPVTSEEAGEALAEIVRLTGEFPEGSERFSMAPRGEDFEIVVEECPAQDSPTERRHYS